MAGGRGLKLAGLSCAELELCFAVGGRYGQLLATHCSQHWSELDSGRDQLTLPACILVTTLSGAETDLRGCFRMNLLIDLNVKFWPWRPGRIISR